MSKHIDDTGTFDCTGSYDFRNAKMLVPIGSTLPTIVKDNGQLFYFDDGINTRLFWTVDGDWHYKDAT
jgi:hypothetical protein